MTYTVSAAASAQGTTISIGDGASPEVFTVIGEVSKWDGPAGTRSVIDVTNLQSTGKEKRGGLLDNGKVTLTLNRVFSDAGQTAAIAALDSPDPVNFKITYPGPKVDAFAAIVTGFKSSGGVDAIIEATIDLEVTGDVTRT